MTPNPSTEKLEDCSGCTDRNSEGTHQMHTKQHPCREGGDPNCGYCFPSAPAIPEWEKLKDELIRDICSRDFNVKSELRARFESLLASHKDTVILKIESLRDTTIPKALDELGRPKSPTEVMDITNRKGFNRGLDAVLSTLEEKK